MLKTVPMIKHDIATVVGKFIEKDDTVAPIPPDRIKAFIKRAGALAESRKSTFVSLGAYDGHLSISFAEGTTSSDEYYLVDEHKVPDMAEVKLDANKLARALERVDELVMDYMGDHVLVLRNNDTGFCYIISGRAPD
jgi:hypothetical protein